MALLSRIWPYLALGAALIGAMLWIDHKGYQRAQVDRAASDAKTLAQIGAVVALIDGKVAARIAQIDTSERTVNNTLIREVQSDARYNAPNGLSTGIVRGLNEARAASCPTGVDCISLPAATPAN